MLGHVVGPLYVTQLPQRVHPQLVHGAADGLLCQGDGPVMVPHQCADAPGGSVVKPQAAADGLCHLRAGPVMAVKMAYAPFVQRKALGLAQIVQQHGPPQHRLRRRGVHRMGRVAPDVIAVVAVVLLKPHTGQDLRQHHTQHLGFLRQHPSGVFSAQQLCQFLPYPFRRHIPQIAALLPQGTVGVLLDGKAQRGGKPQRPQDPQRVLGKAALRLPHAPQHFRLNVLLPAEGIEERSPHIHGHGVDGQIPPGQILRQIPCEGDGGGMAVVGIVSVGAEGGDLTGQTAAADGHGAVPQAGGNGKMIEQRHGLLRQGGGGHIPVVGRCAHQHVPHTAAHHVRLVPGGLQPLQYALHFLRDHDFASLRRFSVKNDGCTLRIGVL